MGFVRSGRDELVGACLPKHHRGFVCALIGQHVLAANVAPSPPPSLPCQSKTVGGTRRTSGDKHFVCAVVTAIRSQTKHSFCCQKNQTSSQKRDKKCFSNSSSVNQMKETAAVRTPYRFTQGSVLTFGGCRFLNTPKKKTFANVE